MTERKMTAYRKWVNEFLSFPHKEEKGIVHSIIFYDKTTKKAFMDYAKTLLRKKRRKRSSASGRSSKGR